MPGASFCVWGACFFCGGVRSVPGLITGTGNSLGRLVQNIGLSSKIFFLREKKGEEGVLLAVQIGRFSSAWWLWGRGVF